MGFNTTKLRSPRVKRTELNWKIPQSGAFLTRPALELHQPHRRRADRGLRLDKAKHEALKFAVFSGHACA
jgi:hypothetical protein